jgi:hypothetical protein
LADIERIPAFADRNNGVDAPGTGRSGQSRVRLRHSYLFCGYFTDGRDGGSLVAFTKRDASGFLRKSVADLHPGCFLPDHEVQSGDPRRVGVEGPEPEPQYLRSGVVALIDG